MSIRNEMFKYLKFTEIDILLSTNMPNFIPCINNINNLDNYNILIGNEIGIHSIEKENLEHFCTIREKGRIKRIGKSLQNILTDINNNLEQDEQPYSIIVFEDKIKHIYEYYELKIFTNIIN